MIEDRGVNGDEFLQTSHPLEPLHCPSPSSEWQVGILGPVVHPATGLLKICGTYRLQSRSVGPK